MLRNWKRIVTMLLGAALFAGSLPLVAHADRDGKRHRERRVEHKQERKHERREVRHHDHDRDHRHAWYRDRDDCAPRRVVYHRDRVVYAPYRPVHSGVRWGLYASNLPPDRCDYWDPYCGQRYGSLHAYRSHLRYARHAHVVHVVDHNGYAVCGYRDRGDDSWMQVTLAGNIRF